jgi:hypothetical protein
VQQQPAVYSCSMAVYWSTIAVHLGTVSWYYSYARVHGRVHGVPR